jgi:hypothetical protein
MAWDNGLLLGAHTLNGCHAHCFCSLLEGKTGVKQISRFDASDFPTTFAAQIENFDNEG